MTRSVILSAAEREGSRAVAEEILRSAQDDGREKWI